MNLIIQTRPFTLRTMAILTNLVALVGCSSAAQDKVTCGPMAIDYSLERDYRLNLFVNNSNGKLIGTHTTSCFRIHYQGKRVTVANREGKKVQIWQARFLTDAPKTAILASSNSVYLVTDDNRSAGAGQARVLPVNEKSGELSTYQWLDSDDGKPGRATSSVPMDNSGSSRFMSGGRYLLVDESSVLDVHTLAIHPFDLISEASIQRTDGFVRVSSGLVSFSPGKTQLVFLGSRYNTQRSRTEYALLAVDFVNNRAYAVPFRASATQLIWAEDATPDWFTTYFDWTTDKQGREVLSVHPYTIHPPWRGRWAQYPGEHQPIRYEVKPVLPGMFDHFMGWAKKKYPAIEPKIDRSNPITSADFTINGSLFHVYVRDDYKQLGLESMDQVLLKTIGNQFDSELRNGRFQDGFGEMEPD